MKRSKKTKIEFGDFQTELLNSKQAQQFYRSFIFWDAKRPVTAKILHKLDLFALAKELGRPQKLESFAQPAPDAQAKQLRLLEKKLDYGNTTTNEI